MEGQGERELGVPRAGEILLGKYRVERVLGVGGMGVVVAARHLQLDERCAIKFLLPKSVESPDVVRRFVREGQAAARIRSEHVARVFDVGTMPRVSGSASAGLPSGECPGGPSEVPYMVLEYLDGNDLGYLLSKGGPLPAPTAVDYLLQACEALAEAHALGIVHRDLKPSNLFVTRRADGTPLVKVLDFGISKIAGRDGADAGMTKTTAVMGSPRYMSPEQMRSTRAVDARTDLWSLGTILYECVTGRPAYDAETMTELCAQVLQDAAPSPSAVVPGLPDAIERATRTCLQKDPSHRFQNVAQLATALAPAGGPGAALSAARIVRVLHAAGHIEPEPVESSVSQPIPVALPRPSSEATASAFGATQSPKPARSRLALALGLGAAGLAVAGVAAVGVLVVARPRPARELPAASASLSPAASGATPASGAGGQIPPLAAADGGPNAAPAEGPGSPPTEGAPQPAAEGRRRAGTGSGPTPPPVVARSAPAATGPAPPPVATPAPPGPPPPATQSPGDLFKDRR